MIKTVENRSITSLLLRLDREELSMWTQQDISQEIAVECRKITRIPQQVGRLLRFENKKISYRGNDLSNYLMDNKVTVEQILTFFFAHSVKMENNKRVLHSYVTISEMMLMLGTFLEFMELRDRNQSEFQKSLFCVKAKRLLPLNKGKKLEWENVLKRELMREKTTMNFLQDLATTVMKSILLSLGLTIKETSKKQLKNIFLASKELCSQSLEWVSYFQNRDKYGPNAFGDMELLEQFEKDAMDYFMEEKSVERKKQYKI